MFAWLRNRPDKAKRLVKRVAEGIREIGILFLALAPIDALMSQAPLRESAGSLLLLVGAGLLFFVLALVLEWRDDK